jgi:uncharacterized protein (TIGR03437 family)
MVLGRIAFGLAARAEMAYGVYRPRAEPDASASPPAGAGFSALWSAFRNNPGDPCRAKDQYGYSAMPRFTRVAFSGLFLTALLSGADKKLAITQMSYAVTAGDTAILLATPESMEFLRQADKATVTTEPDDGHQIAIGRSRKDNSLFIAVPLTMPPGSRSVTIRAISSQGIEREVEFQVLVQPILPVAAGAPPPVILVNGYHVNPLCWADQDSTVTFGEMASFLIAQGRNVFFADNCAICQNCPIEQIAADLGAWIQSRPEPWFDVIAHSMGGLIARSYLAGKNETPGSFSPPVDPKIRKLVTIATPHFGSPMANTWAIGIQSAAMAVGSRFLYDLATWNQRGDDLRGVDALAIVGDAGNSNGLANASDGVVSLTSASLGFARDASRTRILPHCHIQSHWYTIPFMDCSGLGIANVDEAPETGQIVLSFLAGTSDWMSSALSTTPNQGGWLSQYGGMYFASKTAGGQWMTDLTQAAWGTVTLDSGQAAGTIFYNEFVSGTDTFRFTSSSLGSFTCGPVTEPAGYYTVWRCKTPPLIYSVGPLSSGSPGRVVQSGATITIAGTGFGERCLTCGAWAGNTTLQISSWSDQAITAFLPAFTGYTQITVGTTAGQDSIGIMAVPVPTIAVTPANLTFQYTIGGAVPAGQSIQLTNSGGGSLSWTASASANWVDVSPPSGTAPATLSISVNPAGLSPGSYGANVQITATGATGSPAAVVVTLVVQASPSTPTIVAVVNGASFQPGIARGIWASIFGTNLAPTTRNWRSDEIVNGRLPTSLDGVSVTVDGRLAALCYISPTQVNVQVPDSDAIGIVEVVLTNAQGTARVTAVMQTFAPGFFMYGAANGRYIAAQHANYSIVGPPGLYPVSTPARPGEVIVLYATGFGPTAPPTPSGQIVTTAAPLVDPSAVTVWVGGIPAQVQFAGITMAGLWQINVRLPDNLPDGDALVAADIGGVRSQDSAFITVRW